MFVHQTADGDLPSLRLWAASGSLPVLVGAILGSLGSFGVVKLEYKKPRKPIDGRNIQISNERSESMEQIRTDERRARGDDAMGAGRILAIFGLGALAGAVVTLLTTPEPGESVRRRVRRGAETAQEELDGIVGEAKESWGRVRDDAQDAVKRTATKIKEAAKGTKEALVEQPPSITRS